MLFFCYSVFRFFYFSIQNISKKSQVKTHSLKTPNYLCLVLAFMNLATMAVKIRIWLILSTVLLSILLLLSLPLIIMSPMLFDATGSMNNFGANLIFFSLLSFPIVVIYSLTLQWVFYRKSKFKAACSLV